MAREFFGYGRWEAPYWFIGPEQGQGKSENNDLGPRTKAWLRLGASELVDCREYHSLIDERSWHRDDPKPELQRTWKRLILLLLHFLNKPAEIEEIRSYQKNRWGSSEGETCAIELSGLPARNMGVRRDRKSFREERIAKIRQRILEHDPRLVVLYGSQWKSWQMIAGSDFPTNGILRRERKVFVAAHHPTYRKRGWTDALWAELGNCARQTGMLSGTSQAAEWQAALRPDVLRY